MKRAIQLLSLILLLQLGLALVLRLAADNGAADSGGGKLLSIAADRIDGLEIHGPGREKVLLRKIDGFWNLPEHLDAPADSGRIERMLATLMEMERPWPVADSAEAAKRFKVADEDFERRLLLKSGDEILATLLLGSSPGFRKVHARLAGDSLVFDIPFSAYQAGLKIDDWLDRNVLQLEPDQIVAVELPDCRLNLQAGLLKVADLAETEQTDEEKARQLLGRLARLTIQDVFGKVDQPLPAAPVLTLQVQLDKGGERSYQFFPGRDQSYALLKVSGFPHLYQVDPGLLEDLRRIDRDVLVEAKQAVSPPVEDQQAPATAPPPRG